MRKWNPIRYSQFYKQKKEKYQIRYQTYNGAVCMWREMENAQINLMIESSIRVSAGKK